MSFSLFVCKSDFPDLLSTLRCSCQLAPGNSNANCEFWAVKLNYIDKSGGRQSTKQLANKVQIIFWVAAAKREFPLNGIRARISQRRECSSHFWYKKRARWDPVFCVLPAASALCVLALALLRALSAGLGQLGPGLGFGQMRDWPARKTDANKARRRRDEPAKLPAKWKMRFG